jgi:hypothetical protein
MTHLKAVSRVAPAQLPLSPINLRWLLFSSLLQSIFGKVFR